MSAADDPRRSSAPSSEAPDQIAIGYKASAEQFGPRELVEFGVAAEQFGFDSAVVSDHYQPWRHNRGACAVLDLVDDRCRGAHVPDHPGHLGADRDVPLQPGGDRAGLRDDGVPVSGADHVGPGDRGGAQRRRGHRDGVAGVQGTLRPNARGHRPDAPPVDRGLGRPSGRVLHHRGGHGVRQAGASDPGLRRRRGPVVARYAGRVGDGFICTSGKGMALYQEELVPAINEGIAKAGRTPESLDRMIEIKLSYDADPNFALEATRFWAPLSLTPEQKHSVQSSAEMERLADELPIEQVAKRWIVASKPDEAVDAIRPYVDAGFTNLVIHAPGADQGRFMEQFAADVMPRLRELGG